MMLDAEPALAWRPASGSRCHGALIRQRDSLGVMGLEGYRHKLLPQKKIDALKFLPLVCRFDAHQQLQDNISKVLSVSSDLSNPIQIPARGVTTRAQLRKPKCWV